MTKIPKMKYFLIILPAILFFFINAAFSQNELGLNDLIDKSLQNSRTVKASFIDYTIDRKSVV